MEKPIIIEVEEVNELSWSDTLLLCSLINCVSAIIIYLIV